MSTIKTLTSSLTAVALVTSIGFAWAQSEEQPAQPVDTTAMPAAQQQQPVDPALPPTEPVNQQPADTTTAPLPSDSIAAQDNSSLTSTTSTTTTPESTDDLAPRADRN